jgi:superfamily II DNA helicase RecQ
MHGFYVITHEQVVLLTQTLASQGRLAGIFINECQVLDIRLENSFRNFEGYFSFFAKLCSSKIEAPVVFLTATLMEPAAVLLACGLPVLFDEAFYISPMRRNLEITMMYFPDGNKELSSHRIIMQNSVAAIKQHALKHRVLIFVMFTWELEPVAEWLRRSFPGAHLVAPSNTSRRHIIR